MQTQQLRAKRMETNEFLPGLMALQSCIRIKASDVCLLMAGGLAAILCCVAVTAQVLHEPPGAKYGFRSSVGKLISCTLGEEIAGHRCWISGAQNHGDF